MTSTSHSRAARTGRSPAAARKRRRLLVVVLSLALLAVASGLILTAFRDSIVFFYTPSELTEKHVPAGRALRIGGLVEDGSVARDGDVIRFRVTDLKSALPVTYKGILPDLFREGQGVVAEGTLGADGVFQARQVLAKHDETYMPPEVAEALKKSGEWRPEGGGSGGGASGAPPKPGALPQGSGR
jgi:cytochrome c-type biogenesis protein CcmE